MGQRRLELSGGQGLGWLPEPANVNPGLINPKWLFDWGDTI